MGSRPRIVPFPHGKLSGREREELEWRRQMEARVARLEAELKDPISLMRRLAALVERG